MTALPTIGSRCIAGPTDSWGPATIRRVNEDGTFTIEFDVKVMTVLPFWYGVTSSELTCNDEALWPSVFPRLEPNKSGFCKDDFKNAAKRLNLVADDARLDQFWAATCTKLFKTPEAEVANLVLNEGSAYRFFAEGGLYAIRCHQLLTPTLPNHAKVYWNQVRMGGRSPEEVARPVLLEDALAGLGIARNGSDDSAVNACKLLEKENEMELPDALKQLLCRRGAADAVFAAHPNGPCPVWPGDTDWMLRRDIQTSGLAADFALPVMTHMAEYNWLAVFNDRDADARVYVVWEEDDVEHWQLTAPSIGMFFWDLAQTGLAWYQETKLKGGKPVRKTDIGLVLDVH